MKRLILSVLLCGTALSGFSQNTVIGLYGGAGTSLTDNYNVGLSGGLDFTKVGNGRTGFGAQVFYQGYDFLYDREANGLKNDQGNAGVTLLDETSYIFLAPKISQFFTKGGFVEAYLNAGVGFKMSGTETMHKWDRSQGYATYDSTINSSNNINSMLIRIGVGVNEYIHMRGNWWFTFTEDVGYITSSITKSSDYNDPSHTQYSPQGKINPAYISLQIGISHTKRRY